MNPAQIAIGRIGQNTVAGGLTPPPNDTRTLSQRLDSANAVFAEQTHRIFALLERVNGTPRTPTPEATGAVAAVPPMLASIETAEMLSRRLCDLCDGLERIA